MNLFEYQGKALFATHGVRVPQSVLVSSPDEVPQLEKGGVVKPQIQIGGRGKAGAIRMCENAEEARELVSYFLKTPVKGHLARKVLIEERVEIAREYYFSISIDRRSKAIAMMFSGFGGVEIENNADKIKTVTVNPLIGLQPYMVRNLLAPFELDSRDQIAEVVEKLFALFMEKKMNLLEVNPLVVTAAGEAVALDAKVILDDWVAAESDKDAGENTASQTPFEELFASVGANAVEMDGDVAVYAGGAGAAMASGDCIISRGGTLRCLVDRGTIASDTSDDELSRELAGVIRTILDLKPKVIFLNVYFQAGRMDYESRTLKRAFGDADRTVPVVARLAGRMAEEGRRNLEDTGIFVTDSLEAAVDKIMEYLKEEA